MVLMIRWASAIILAVSSPIEEITANSSPPSRATRSSPRKRARQPQCDVADQFVADRMAEGVVDVFEMVEIDVEHRRRRAAVAHLVDHRLQALAEENAVGQAAERIVHGEMAQARFADGDRRRGAPHVAQHEGGEQGEAGKRHSDERNDAVHDLGAGLFRRPGEAGDLVAVLVREVVDVIAGRHRPGADAAQMGELQLIGDAGEQAACDEFHRHQDRRAARRYRRRTDGGGGDHRRLAADAADHGSLRARAVGVVADADGGTQRRARGRAYRRAWT